MIVLRIKIESKLNLEVFRTEKINVSIALTDKRDTKAKLMILIVFLAAGFFCALKITLINSMVFYQTEKLILDEFYIVCASVHLVQLKISGLYLHTNKLKTHPEIKLIDPLIYYTTHTLNSVTKNIEGVKKHHIEVFRELKASIPIASSLVEISNSITQNYFEDGNSSVFYHKYLLENFDIESDDW